VEEYDYHLGPNIHLRVNYDRYGVLIRDELIIKAAEDRWNVAAAEVMRAILAASLDEDATLADGRTHDDVKLNAIIDRIPQSSHPLLMAGIAGAENSSIPEVVRQYLKILAGEDQVIGNGGAFLQRNDASDPGYKVELESVCRRLRASLLTELVRERLGKKAARVLAVVAKASKAGETTVSDISKSSRQTLTLLGSGLRNDTPTRRSLHSLRASKALLGGNARSTKIVWQIAHRSSRSRGVPSLVRRPTESIQPSRGIDLQNSWQHITAESERDRQKEACSCKGGTDGRTRWEGEVTGEGSGGFGGVG